MLYRVHTNLSRGGGKVIYRGSITTLRELQDNAVKALLKTNSISPVSAPPLIALGTEWKSRADRLAKVGIITVEELLLCDVSKVAAKIRAKDETIQKWRIEAEAAIK